MSDITAAFATETGRLRTQRGLSQVQLAREAGISASMLSLIECGKTGPSLTVALRLARALGGSLDEMTGLCARGESGSRNQGGTQ